MLQRIALAITIVCLGICGGVLAPFLRGMHAVGRSIRVLLCFCVGNRAGVHGCQRDRRIPRAEPQCSKRMLSRNSSEIPRCLTHSSICVPDRLSNGSDRIKLWSTSPIRHSRIRGSGVFHRRGVGLCCLSSWSGSRSDGDTWA